VARRGQTQGRQGPPRSSTRALWQKVGAVDPNLECVAPQALIAAARLLRDVHVLVYRQRPSPDVGPHVPAPLPGVVLRYMTLVPPRRLPALTPTQRRDNAAKRSGATSGSGAAWASAISTADGVGDPAALRVRELAPSCVCASLSCT
jgi:hypothetical protein